MTQLTATEVQMEKWIGHFEIHPAASLFPEMDEKSLADLVESVKEHGIRVPLVLFEGKLLDGRNRARAALALGIPPEKIPQRALPEGTDPYAYAWDLNCARLDYTPGQKVEIRLKVMEASGELARIAAEAKAKADAARSEKAKEQPRDAHGRMRRKRTGAPSHEGSPGPRAHKSKAAQAAAAATGASASTAERKMRPRRVNFRRKLPDTWRVPRPITELARFLASRLTIAERQKLGEFLLQGFPPKEEGPT